MRIVQKSCHRRRHEDEGAAAVEFALILPLLLLVLFGLIDFGRAFHAQISMTQAAREGARLQSFSAGDTTVTAEKVAQRVRDAATGVPGDSIGVETAVPCAAGDPTTVRAKHTFDFLTPIGAIGAMFGEGSGLSESMTITGIGVMRCGG